MKKLIEALKTIQDECNKHCYENCASCPMYSEDDKDGCLVKCEPSDWTINENVTKALLYEPSKPVLKREVANNE